MLEIKVGTQTILNLKSSIPLMRCRSLTAGTADYFMWERFMTKTISRQRNFFFRRIADCPTPWPCFVIAGRDEVLENNPEVIKDILSCINEKNQKVLIRQQKLPINKNRLSLTQ
jgi:hypothetical protein